MSKEDLCVNMLLNVLEVGKLTSVVRSYGLHMPLERQKHAHYGPCQRSGLLALWKLPHHHEIGATFYQCQDHPLSLTAYDTVHLPVSEPLIVHLVHISQLSKNRVRSAGDAVKVGQKVRVRVLGVDLERKRISLTMKL